MCWSPHDLGWSATAPTGCVMFLGRVCEVGPTEALFTAPRHPYTRFLLDSVPRPDPTRRGEGREPLPGEIPSPVTPPSGCRFRTRCPYAAPVCAQAPPPLQGTGEHRVACHAPHGEG
ncbi:MAG: oligopeptide/dipeptide ABC transporter ATP-binding protein [Evtepia gabavorous]